MWNLPSDVMKINTTGKLFDQWEKDKIIENYEMSAYAGRDKRIFNTDEVWHTNNNDSPEYYKGLSKLEPIRKNLSNIAAVLKTANVLYNERGGLFLFSQDSKGEFGGIPIEDKDKKDIERQYRKDYGIHEDQSRYIMTSASMKATPISYPIKDLMLFEELEADFSAILSMYGMKRDLFPSVKGATFENQVTAERSTYESTIQPNADDKARILTDILRLEDKGLRLKASFEHLSVMQEDEKMKADRERIRVDTLIKQWQEGLITRNDARTAQGLEEVTEEEMNRFSWQNLSQEGALTPDAQAIIDAQASLRGSVGGVSGLVSIVQSVSEGVMPTESGVEILVNIYGLDEETARRIIPTVGN